MKKNNPLKFLILCSMILSVTGCGGRTASPVMISQYGDQNKSCRALEFEMSTVQGEIQRLLPETDKTGKNIALGVAGWFLLVPWFFMDFKDAEKQEYEAYRQRYNYLASIAVDKKCEGKRASYPSIDEMKKTYEEQVKKKKQPNNTSN
jgi:hypothetical protein